MTEQDVKRLIAESLREMAKACVHPVEPKPYYAAYEILSAEADRLDPPSKAPFPKPMFTLTPTGEVREPRVGEWCLPKKGPPFRRERVDSEWLLGPLPILKLERCKERA